jgi:hypothetical protein
MILVDGIATVVLSTTKRLSAAVQRVRIDSIAGHSENAPEPGKRPMCAAIEFAPTDGLND